MNDILFGNNNKAVIKKLANRSFRSNKMRNVIAVIAIALTTFLFTAVLTIGMGANGTLEYSMAKLMGSSADALVQGLSEEQFQQLKRNAMFEKVGCWIPVEIMTNTNRRVAEVDYADQTQLEIRMLTPRTGSAPQKANEVLVSANILKDLNIEEKIGAEIPVELKVRQSDQVYHFDMVVSGIYDTPNEKSESVIVSKAFLEENAEMMNDIAQGRVGCGIYTADVVMRDNYMVKDRISELVRNIGGNPDDVNAANAVRVAPNPIVSNESGLMMWLVAGVFGILFMFCGYLLIYNVFEIAVTNDIRQYGLLRTVGTTSRQIRRLVNRQALYLFLIGTPFGLLFGTLIGRSILTMKATVSGVKNVVLLIGGVIGAVFALVGLINFINLVMTNIITRRHEFATMQSIGMTNQQLRKMMISESFSYVLLAGIVGTLAAGVLGMTLVRAFVDISPSSIMMTFQMTLLPALIMLVLFLVLAFIVPVIALRLFNNRSVVERLRVNE